MASKDKAKKADAKRKEKEKAAKAKLAAAALKAKEAAAKQKAKEKEKALKEKEKAAAAALKAKEAAAKKKPLTPLQKALAASDKIQPKKPEPKSVPVPQKTGKAAKGAPAGGIGTTFGKAKDLLRAIVGGKPMPGAKEETPADTRRTAAGVESLKRVAGAAAPVKGGNTAEQPAEGEDAAGPLLDLSDAAVKKMIKAAKKRGYVTYDQLNDVMPSEEVTSEQIEDVLAMMNDMGINVVEAEDTDGEEEEDDDDDDTGTDLVESGSKSLATAKKSEPGERTDDPVRMYLREMGSVELLSREGEIAIAKRIEAGREAMIAGLCESPLTFQAIIVWRDELAEAKALLRDIIDLEATYAGP
ncbi:MAG: RNA polymerase sigma factor region1.1 domain-containing protein, partial [Xanthobacteraceae bacterium]